MNIDRRLKQVQERIQTAANASHCAPAKLIAVSKTKPLSMVMEAYQAGQKHFGENYLQDALSKIHNCTQPDIIWHFIGSVQSNKTSAIAENFDWLHTLDRFKIAQRLNAQRPDHLPPLNVLIQVNINNEATKGGVTLENLPALAKQINALPRLHWCGLMCIPQADLDPAQTQQTFTLLAHTRDKLQEHYPQVTELSMGMSADLELAIAAGATWVRIGTDIFGSRT